MLEADATIKTYSGTEANLKMDDFAYFGLSMAWRSTFSWIVKGEPDTQPITLGYFTEPIRAFLAGETTEFPRNIAVLVIACTDTLSRRAWFLPTPNHDAWMYEVRFLALGVFRAMMGKSAWTDFGREACNGHRQ